MTFDVSAVPFVILPLGLTIVRIYYSYIKGLYHLSHLFGGEQSYRIAVFQWRRYETECIEVR